MPPDVQPAIEPDSGAGNRESEPRHPSPDTRAPILPEARRGFASSLESRLDRHLDIVALLIIAIGFVLRVIPAARFYLNPDEASNLATGLLPSMRALFAEIEVSPHPPLYFLVLHIWRWLGTSDFMVRLPSILAWTGMLWIFFRWLVLAFSRATALIGLTLMALAPEMIAVSYEVRQYSLLLLFMALTLYWFEAGLRERSPGRMLLVGAAGILMVSTHYSALVFLLIMGIYGVLRLVLDRPPARVVASWLGGQAVIAGLTLFYYVTHLSKLHGSIGETMAREDWLRASYYHPGRESLPWFALRQFHAVLSYVFSQPIAGFLAAVLFAFGLVLLFASSPPRLAVPQRPRAPRPWPIALLAILAFVIACGIAAAGAYPFGGSRHSVYLALFAIPPISVGLAFIAREKLWPVLLATVLLVPLWHWRMVPPAQYIAPHNQTRNLVMDMTDYVRQLVVPATDTTTSLLAPRASPLSPSQRRTAGLIFTDLQTQDLLRRYLVHNYPTPVRPLPEGMSELTYPDYRLALCGYWSVSADTFGDEFERMARVYGLKQDDTVCVVAGGWGYNLADQLRTRLRIVYPGTRKFGDDLSVFRVAVGTEPTRRNIARRSQQGERDLESLAAGIAKQKPAGLRSVFWPTDLLTDSTYAVTRKLTDHALSYYELYAGLQSDPSRFDMYLPALAFWEIKTPEPHPIPMLYLKDLDNFVSGDYRFTLLAVTADSLAAVYEITSDAGGR